jgi:glycosyltransferase involved in cell wall biosynthesis
MKIAAVLIAHNVAPWVDQAFASILQQTRKPQHVIVVENGSSDGTLEVLERAAGGHQASCKLSLISESALGASGARNRGAELALQSQADAIAFLDGDDWWQPTFVERLAPVLERDSESRAVFGWSIVRGEEGRFLSVRIRLRRGFTYRDLGIYKSPMLTTSALMVRSSEFERVGGFRRSIHCGEDWELLLRLVRSGGSVRCHRSFVVNYRKRAGSLASNVEASVDGLRIIQKDHPNTNRAKHWWWPLNEAYGYGQTELIRDIRRLRPPLRPADLLSPQFVKYLILRLRFFPRRNG